MRQSTVKFCTDLAGETVTNVDIGGSSFMEHGRAEHMGIFSAVDFFAKF